jgi:PIN domain nuclease of toxin-antitoxin system
MPARAGRRKRTVGKVAARYAVRRVLLDTHTWLWWSTGDSRLGDRAATLIRRADEVHFSVVSAWEIAIKSAIGKLTVSNDVDLSDELERSSFDTLPITLAHAEAVRALPMLHRDPFDRLLVAQARVEGLTIVSGDDHLTRYDVPVIDARV